jgi:DNA-binding MarR family transcriptional regulator
MAGGRRSSILLDLYAMAHLAGGVLDPELAARGVSSDDFGLLSMIVLHEPVTPTRLAAELGVPPTTLSSMLQRLVENGLARREPNPVDGRSALISLTDEGLARARSGSPAVRAAVSRIADELERPFDEVAAALEDLHRAMRAALAAGTREERRSA